MRYRKNWHKPSNVLTKRKQHLNNAFKSYKHFLKIPYISGTLGGTVFKLLRYLLSMISTRFCAGMLNGLKAIAIYYKFQNGKQVV